MKKPDIPNLKNYLYTTHLYTMSQAIFSSSFNYHLNWLIAQGYLTIAKYLQENGQIGNQVQWVWYFLSYKIIYEDPSLSWLLSRVYIVEWQVWRRAYWATRPRDKLDSSYRRSFQFLRKWDRTNPYKLGRSCCRVCTLLLFKVTNNQAKYEALLVGLN